MTPPEPAPDARETAKTGGWLLQAPAAFLRQFKGRKAPRKVPFTPARSNILETQTWRVTWTHPNGETRTTAVLISGIWRLGDLETQARNALDRQHGITNAQIQHLTLDLAMTPARHEALQSIFRQHQSRMRFEQDCG